MAKRHPSLVLLSHDHHHGLALALRLRQGDAALLTDGWTHDPGRQRGIVAEFHRKELVPHFAAEEEALFPVVRAEIPAATPLVEKLTAEHRALGSAIAALDGVPADVLPAMLASVGALLEHHIRAEERELFPALEASMSPETADRLGREIDRVHRRTAALSRAPVHAGGEVVVDAPTTRLYTAVLSLDNYGRWWPESVRFSRAPSAAGIPAHTLTAGETILRIRVEDLRQDRRVALALESPSWTGAMIWDVTDFHGGRKVRCAIDLEPAAGADPPAQERLAAMLQGALDEALEGLAAEAHGAADGERSGGR